MEKFEKGSEHIVKAKEELVRENKCCEELMKKN